MADVCCKAGDCRKIQHELIHGNLAAQRHNNQHGVSGAVAQKNDAKVDKAGKELPSTQPFLPGNVLIG